MIPRSNLHTHTTFCDGKNTPEEMVLRAIELEYESIGFSAHAYTPCEPVCSVPENMMTAYRDEILRLRDIYNDKIEIYLGLEVDIYSATPAYSCDYIIGSLHYIKCGEEYIAVDDTPEIAESMVNTYFGGDWLKYARKYYETEAEVPRLTGCDIIGHFDLLTKFNEGFAHFNENDPKYIGYAVEAIRQMTKTCKLFEINTGAIYRKRRTMPYPSINLLKEIKKAGGEIIISSDSHNVESLGYMFDLAVNIARDAGYKYAKVLKNGKFTDIKI